ncbi:MAG: PIN domain-containing protein [Candidatus Omnitrophica bacterium]|nr:PIN domain-containing protein [Candidatus Omnitrophota bacterium]
MTANVFFDSNILVYAHCVEEPQKMCIAREYIEDGTRYGIGVVSVQVLNEFYVVATQKRKVLTPAEGREGVMLLSGLRVQDLDLAIVFSAFDIEREYKIHYWDALIIASAQKAGCQTLLSEDLNHNQRFGRLTVKNPFKK